MSELAILEERRRLVELSADLQRATLTRRLANIENRPRIAALDALAALGRNPAARKLALTGALMLFRAWRRRRARR